MRPAVSITENVITTLDFERLYLCVWPWVAFIHGFSCGRADPKFLLELDQRESVAELVPSLILSSGVPPAQKNSEYNRLSVS
jgi:hypothetical protein